MIRKIDQITSSLVAKDVTKRVKPVMVASNIFKITAVSICHTPLSLSDKNILITDYESKYMVGFFYHNRKKRHIKALIK